MVAMAASPLSPKVAHAQEAAASRKDASKKEGAKLDGAERQRHLRLWAKQLADEQSRIKAEAHAVQMLGARAQEGDAEAQAAIQDEVVAATEKVGRWRGMHDPHAGCC